MLDTLRQRKVARVLFDEAHGEAWTIRPEVAATMHGEHPQDSSYAGAARALAVRDFEVGARTEGPLTAEALGAVDVLVIAHPSDDRWERTVGGSPLFSGEEIAAVRDFVTGGGGLVVLGETEQEKYGSNLNELLAPFGVRLLNATAADYVHFDGTPMWVQGQPDGDAAEGSVLHFVGQACFYRAGALEADAPGAMLLRTSEQAEPAAAGLLAAVRHGEGRVVVAADSDLFGDDFLGRLDHEQLWLNLLYWVANAAFRAEPAPILSEAAQDPAWRRLKDETNALRLLQEPKGEVDLEKHDLDEVRERIAAMSAAIGALAPRFPHQRAYLEQVPRDLDAWLEGGCQKPDFMESLALFRPEQNRRDGIEHLVVFPMYTPNGSPDIRFEALIVRTPWPDFIDRLERESYHNEKFVPVQLVDYTDGYDSECAVLFPETVSLRERPTNNFGAIFCDRESSRFQRTLLKGHEVMGINLPPDAAALAQSSELLLDTYILWDLVHDSWHSHGDLPFDPFMIRQRLPYWMYSLEELRVDLSAYVDSGRLAREGFPFARYVQYAMLFDRILRFPITGNRVRNYDGLGGQLLFAFLHQRGIVQWHDNTLLVDWVHVEEAVGALRDEIEALYRRGIDLSKVSYWIEAHDLVSRYLRPNVLSQWKKDARVVTDEADFRAWIDRVHNDEFPLSMFYEQVKKRLLPPEEAPAATASPAPSVTTATATPAAGGRRDAAA
jgi:hypothetical protein